MYICLLFVFAVQCFVEVNGGEIKEIQDSITEGRPSSPYFAFVFIHFILPLSNYLQRYSLYSR